MSTTGGQVDVDPIERIIDDGRTLCYIVRAALSPSKTTFVTPQDLNLQVGYVVYLAGRGIQRHMHRPIERRIVGTSEVLVIRRGRCEIDVYGEDRRHVATRELAEGDVVVLVSGGHGFRMTEDTVLLEIKQGPYAGIDDKERF